MPKFARPNQYTGKQSNQSFTGSARAANEDEAAAGEATNLYISPSTLAAAVGDLVPSASATVEGVVFLTEGTSSIAYPVATKFYADNLAIAGAPAWSETVSGIGQLSTQAETNAGTNDNTAITPLKLATLLAGGSGPGSFTDLTATGTVSFTGATGGIVMTSATASSFGTTGAGIDLTLSSAAGQVIINGEEAAANAVRILSAAGGLDVDVALLLSLTSSRNNANAIELVASAGGIDITAAGAAGEDIDIVNTAGSVNITAGESGTDAIVISATIGGIQINAPGAAVGEDIALTATGSSIRLVSTESAGDAIYLESTAGGIQLLATGAAAGEDIVITATGSSVKLESTESAADSITLTSTAGGIDILATGAAAGEDIDIVATGSSVNIQATESDTNAITINASGVAGGINVDAGTGGVIVDTTGAISLDAAAASNLTVTGAFALDVITTLGKLRLQSGQSAADSVEIKSLIGGIDILAAGAAAGEDIDIIATGSSVNVQATESDVNAITINASGAAGGINVDAGTNGVIVDTTGAISLDAAAASNFTATGAFDVTVQSTAGSVLILGGEAAVDAVTITAGNAAGGLDLNAGTGGVTVDTTAAISLDSATASNFTVTGAADLTLASSAGAVNITSGEANADSLNMTSGGGFSLVATGGAAKDVIITSTSGSMTLSAGESITDAMNFTAGGAASGINLTAGTNGILFSSGQKVKVTSVAAAVTPYALLGTDFFVACDVTGGVLTITLPASPATGRYVIVSDSVGQAAANTLTIDGNGKNISLAGTAAGTKTITTAYKAIGLMYNGTIWNGFALA